MSALAVRVRRPSRSAARAAGTYLRGGVVAEHEAADREAPGREPDERRAMRSDRWRRPRGRAATRTSARGCPPCPPTPRRCAGRRASRERERRDGDQRPRGRARSTITTSTAAGRSSTSRAPPRPRQQHPVGDRVEDLAELAALVEVAGDVAVDPVGRAEHREQHRGRDAARPRPQQQPEEHGHAQQPDDARSRSGSSRCARFAAHSGPAYGDMARARRQRLRPAGRSRPR